MPEDHHNVDKTPVNQTDQGWTFEAGLRWEPDMIEAAAVHGSIEVPEILQDILADARNKWVDLPPRSGYSVNRQGILDAIVGDDLWMARTLDNVFAANGYPYAPVDHDWDGSQDGDAMQEEDQTEDDRGQVLTAEQILQAVISANARANSNRGSCPFCMVHGIDTVPLNEECGLFKFNDGRGDPHFCPYFGCRCLPCRTANESVRVSYQTKEVYFGTNIVQSLPVHLKTRTPNYQSYQPFKELVEAAEANDPVKMMLLFDLIPHVSNPGCNALVAFEIIPAGRPKPFAGGIQERCVPMFHNIFSQLFELLSANGTYHALNVLRRKYGIAGLIHFNIYSVNAFKRAVFAQPLNLPNGQTADRTFFPKVAALLIPGTLDVEVVAMYPKLRPMERETGTHETILYPPLIAAMLSKSIVTRIGALRFLQDNPLVVDEYRRLDRVELLSARYSEGIFQRVTNSDDGEFRMRNLLKLGAFKARIMLDLAIKMSRTGTDLPEALINDLPVSGFQETPTKGDIREVALGATNYDIPTGFDRRRVVANYLWHFRQFLTQLDGPSLPWTEFRATLDPATQQAMDAFFGQRAAPLPGAYSNQLVVKGTAANPGSN